MSERQELIILGSSGLVGSRSREKLETSGVFSVIYPTSSELDVTDKKAVAEWVAEVPCDTIINLAAYTDVDGAEKERGNEDGEAWSINVKGVRNLAEVAKREGRLLVQISTDFAFPGTKEYPGPYAENSKLPVSPDSISWYGWTKLKGEEAVREAGVDHAIVRIAYPFGNSASDKDFALKVLRLIQTERPLFSDQQITPTYILDLAEALARIARRRLTGTYHVACPSLTSPFEFGKRLAEKLGLAGEVKKGSMVKFMQKRGRTPRPRLGGLDTEESEKVLGIRFKTWQEAIDEFVGQLQEKPSTF